MHEAAVNQPAMRIALVDDNRPVRDALQRFLEAAGNYDVESYDSADEFFRKSDVVSLDLLITDWQMPVQNGWQLAAQVRREGNTVPILITSGADAPRFPTGSLPGISFMPKPIRPTLLLETVEGLVLNGRAA